MAQTTTAPVVTTDRPGYGLGIAGFIVSFVAPLVGLVLSIIGLRQSKRAGQSNGLAVAGIVIGSLGTVVGILFGILFIVAAAMGTADPSMSTY